MFTRHLFLGWLSALVLGVVAWALAAPPAAADLSHARIIRLSLVQGDVRFARDPHGDPLTNGKNIWEAAPLNLPIREGYVLATDHGRAEVEFENGAMAFLDENTVIEFYDLSLDNGARTTRLVLRQGAASFYVNPATGDYFSVTGGDFTAQATERATFRLDNFDDGSSVNVLAGHLSVVHKDKTTALTKGQSLSMSAGDANAESIGRVPDADDFDRWFSGRIDSVVTATNASLQYTSNASSYTSGLGDLYNYGSWFPVSGYGYGWQPYGVGLGWSPFDFANGGWFQDSVFGWGFVGSQPWGWLPYHYGGWLFQPGFGWVWVPGNLGNAGWTAWRPVTGTWVHSRTGGIGLVPTHPVDIRGKTPINIERGIFAVSGGAVSPVVVPNSSDTWKIGKAPARDALASSLTASARPEHVSRTTFSGGSGNRIVSIGADSGITYDAREHRFVNAEGKSSSASANSEKEKETASGAQTGKSPATSASSANPAAKSVTTSGKNTASRSAEPAAPRRALTPPPPASERGAGSETWGAGRGGSASSSRAAAASSASGHASSGAAGSSGGGHPH